MSDAHKKDGALQTAHELLGEEMAKNSFKQRYSIDVYEKEDGSGYRWAAVKEVSERMERHLASGDSTTELNAVMDAAVAITRAQSLR